MCRVCGVGKILLAARHRFLVDLIARRQHLQALLTLSYRSTGCLCRAGASMKYLSHKLSLLLAGSRLRQHTVGLNT